MAENKHPLLLFPIVILSVLLLPVVPCRAQPNAHKNERMQPDFEEGLVPLFVLGDLNEDGRVDHKDRELLENLVRAGRTDGVSCVAAGDLNLDLKVDEKDLDRLDDWLRQGGVDIPALTFEPTLACKFRHLFVAARFDALPDEDVPIRFLDRNLKVSNSKVSIESGPASVAPASDGNGYIVSPSSSAKAGDTITVLLDLRGSKYYYTFVIRPEPQSPDILSLPR